MNAYFIRVSEDKYPKLACKCQSQDTGVILGGAVSGGKSTGEMVNVLSACILHRMTANDIVMFQMGTHPALTSSPIAYPIVNAACKAVLDIKGLWYI